MIWTDERPRFLAAALLASAATPALCQTGAPPPAPADGSGLQEIVVTAQKREQNLQDVPIAVTALTGAALTTNRIANVTDLSGLAPGMTVRSAAGGSSIPSFTIRGSVSYGVVPGSDRQVSIYLDGVYVSAPRGATFDLPDIERIEVLRGPQGTLFGRNATAGAVSITTHAPTGKFGMTGRISTGNLDQFRLHLGVDTPRVGPFSAYVSVLRDYRRGDIRNAGAGQVWDRTSSPDPLAAKVRRSPRYLGTKDVDAVFAALKLDLGDFKTIYRFDLTRNQGTPEGVGLVGYSNANSALANFMRTLITTQATPVNIASDGRRPKVVNNAYTIPLDQRNVGHSVTSTWALGDGLSLRNVFGYRTTKIFSAQAIDGVSSLILTPQAAPLLRLPASLVGSPFIGFGTAVLVRNKQYSDELQLNYDSRLLTLTAGALWFRGIDRAGTNHVASTLAFTPVAGGVFGIGAYTDTLNRATSIAGYAQAELHVTSRLDIVGGARLTRDRKSGRFIIQTATDLIRPTFTYRDTRPNYSIGVNYKPTRDLLFYGKYSTAFVSGGSIANIPFQPETARSWEAGAKADLLDRRLRANLALFDVTYRNLQTSQSAALVPGIPPYLGTFILSQGGPVKARGFELEVTAAPVRGVTLGGSLSYTRATAKDVNPVIVAASGGDYALPLRPKWTGGLWGQLDSPPVVDDAYLSLRTDGIYQSGMLLDMNPVRSESYAPNFARTPAYWIVNGRLSLRNLKLRGVETEVALFGRNLLNSRAPTYGLNLNNVLVASSYVTARTYGGELLVRF